MTSKTPDIDDEEINLKEALLNDQNQEEKKKLAPGQLEEIDDFKHWGPCKKGLILLVIMFGNCYNLYSLVQKLVKPNQVLPLQDGSDARLTVSPPTLKESFASKEQEDFLMEEAALPMEFEIITMEEVLNNTRLITGTILPPFHPHHTATVTDSSRMDPDGSVEYRRDINAPCEFGMLIFSVGPAKDDLPYTYELYNDAYLYSDNNGLCMFYPSYNGYQTSHVPLWNPTDPLQVVLKPLDKSIMHWISSRVYDPYKSKKKWDRTKVGDYAIIAKYNFYDPGFYKGLKATINAWK